MFPDTYHTGVDADQLTTKHKLLCIIRMQGNPSSSDVTYSWTRDGKDLNSDGADGNQLTIEVFTFPHNTTNKIKHCAQSRSK